VEWEFFGPFCMQALYGTPDRTSMHVNMHLVC